MARFDRTILAGGEGKITLELRTKGYEGHVHKSARVTSNDPKNAQLTIAMKGKIWTPIQINPKQARLVGPLGEKIETVVHLRGHKKEPLTVKLVSVSIPDKVAVELKEIEKGRSYELRAKNKVETQGTYLGHVILTSNYPEKPEIRVRVSGNIKPHVEVRPKALSFGGVSERELQELKKKGRLLRRPVKVVLHKGNDLRIEKVELEESLFAVVTKERKPGRMVLLLVEPVLEKLKKGPNMDRLKIYTNQKDHEVLVVPISLKILQEQEDDDRDVDDPLSRLQPSR